MEMCSRLLEDRSLFIPIPRSQREREGTCREPPGLGWGVTVWEAGEAPVTFCILFRVLHKWLNGPPIIASRVVEGYCWG